MGVPLPRSPREAGMIEMLPKSDEYVEQEACPERRLMLAVLLTAIRDASGINIVGTPHCRRQTQMLAFGWIKDGDSDFQEVCALAGLDPNATRRKALQFIGDPRNSVGRRYVRNRPAS